MISAVLLELEGVIADTRDARRQALLDSVGAHGITLTDAEYLEHCAALPVRAAVRAAFALRDAARNASRDDTGVELAALRAEHRFASLMEAGLTLAHGAREFVTALHGHARLGIVSRAARRDIDHVLALAGLDHSFEFVIADDDAYAPKPSPSPYLGALERLGRRGAVTAGTVVALEDGATGIRSAKDAGLRCAVIGALPVHIAVNADAILPSLAGQTVASIDALTSAALTAER